MSLVFVIVLTCLRFGGAEITIVSRNYEFPENQLVINYPWHDNTKLLYARCNSSELGLDKKCIVAVMIDAFENSTGVPTECEVVLKPGNSETIISDSFYVYKFGSDKVIVVWMELQDVPSEDDTRKSILKTSLKTTVVRMLDHCQTFHSNVIREYQERFIPGVAHVKVFSLIASKDTYEVIIKKKIDDADAMGLGRNILEFDAQAKLLSAKLWPVPTYKDKKDANIVVAIEPGNAENGYFVFNCDLGGSVAMIMIKQENTNEYKEVILEETSDTKSRLYSGVSLANKAIGICDHFTSNSSTVCSQFDHKGQRLLYTQMSFNQQRQIPVPTIHNLRNGGFLMVVDDCPNESCVGWNDHYALFKIEREDTIDVVKFQFDTDCVQPNKQVVTRAFENKENRYCVARLCESKVNNSIRLDTSVRCFSSNVFSKCDDCVVKSKIQPTFGYSFRDPVEPRMIRFDNIEIVLKRIHELQSSIKKHVRKQ